LLKQRAIDTSLVKIVEGRKTTTKTRFLAGQKQLLRVDYQQGDNVFDSFLPNIPNETDVVILSDYDYGDINREIINHVVSRFSTKINADPKFKNFWQYTDV
jgi:D-beta-D-heptose 7-phosphate kinase/D-beta-D-heptose 1-phosphate adenosyltransferase